MRLADVLAYHERSRRHRAAGLDKMVADAEDAGVLLDTCVLLKSYLCDTLLSIAEEGVYRPLWSDHVLAELRRNLGSMTNHPKDRHVLAAADAVLTRSADRHPDTAANPEPSPTC